MRAPISVLRQKKLSPLQALASVADLSPSIDDAADHSSVFAAALHAADAWEETITAAHTHTHDLPATEQRTEPRDQMLHHQSQQELSLPVPHMPKSLMCNTIPSAPPNQEDLFVQATQPQETTEKSILSATPSAAGFWDGSATTVLNTQQWQDMAKDDPELQDFVQHLKRIHPEADIDNIHILSIEEAVQELGMNEEMAAILEELLLQAEGDLSPQEQQVFLDKIDGLMNSKHPPISVAQENAEDSTNPLIGADVVERALIRRQRDNNVTVVRGPSTKQ